MTPMTTDVFDELAALFLTEPDGRSGAADGGSSQPPPAAGGENGDSHRSQSHSDGRGQFQPRPEAGSLAELLIVGHLPVRAALWLGPYADALARQRGPAALVRLGESEDSIELFRAEPGLGAEGMAHVAEAIGRIAPDVTTWIVRPAPGGRDEELRTSSVDRITILTAADQAASVALYQIIKELAESWRNAGATMPPLALAVVGCDRQRAIELVQRLNRTTSTFLGLEAGLSLCLPHMDAGIRATGHWSFPSETGDRIQGVLKSIEEARLRQRGRGAPTVSETPRMTTAPSSDVQTPRRGAAAPVGAQVESTVSAAQPAARSSASVAAPTGAPMRVKLPPKPATIAAAAIEAKAPAAPREPDHAGAPLPLAAHIEGVATLPIRCPGRERVELGVDALGRLHVIAWEANLRDLMVVEGWARAHRELIGMACPQQALDPAARMVQHVFTDQPVAVADLHGAGLLLHVLAPVRGADQTAWYSAPLNAAAL